jgi:hypothetical protein
MPIGRPMTAEGDRHCCKTQGIQNKMEGTLHLRRGDLNVDNISEVAHLLYFETNIKTVIFHSSSKKLDPHHWLPLITSFQSSTLRENVHHLAMYDHKIPLSVVMTSFWQFRNLQTLTLDYTFFEARKLDKNHWQSLSDAFWNHPSLQKFSLFRPNSSEVSANDGLTTTLSSSVPALREYTQSGVPGSNGSSDVTSSLHPSTVISLIRSKSLRKLAYEYGDFHLNMGVSRAFVDALTTTNLVELSLKANFIGDAAAVLIAEGVRVSFSVDQHFAIFT